MDYKKIIENAREYAGGAIEEYKLIDFVNDADLAWEVLDLISKDEEFVPFIIGEINDPQQEKLERKRTDVKTIKANSNRRVALKKWLKTEVNPYKEFYEEELLLLDAYAIQVITDLHKVNPDVVSYFNKLLKTPHRRRVS